jgi:hypothetical protein
MDHKNATMTTKTPHHICMHDFLRQAVVRFWRFYGFNKSTLID